EVRDAEERREEGVAARLLDQTLAGVDQDDREVRGRRARHHVARVLQVPRRVGDDELAPRRREVAVGDVDRDPLLALGAQAVGQQREVGALVAASAAHLLHVLELILEDRLGVVEKPPDQRRLAVVDAAGGDEAQEIPPLLDPAGRVGVARDRSLAHDQKYPSRLRSSIAASVKRSSARVAPRSVTRAAATSSMTSWSVYALLRTAPVQVMSPIVRKRT